MLSRREFSRVISTWTECILASNAIPPRYDDDDNDDTNNDDPPTLPQLSDDLNSRLIPFTRRMHYAMLFLI